MSYIFVQDKKMSEQRNPAFFLSGEKPAVQKKAGFLGLYTGPICLLTILLHFFVTH